MFERLSAAERLLIRNVKDEQVCDLPSAFPNNEKQRVIRPHIIRGICSGKYVRKTPIVIKLRGAIFEEMLNLSQIEGQIGLEFIECDFIGKSPASKTEYEYSVDLTGARIKYLHMYGCLLEGGLLATRCEFEQDVRLISPNARDWYTIELPSFNRECTIKGKLHLAGTVIGRQLDLSGAKLEFDNRQGLFALGIRVNENLFFRDGFTAKGGVWINDAFIGQRLICEGGQFLYAGDRCFAAGGTVVGGSVYLCGYKSTEFTANGEVWLNNVDISGDLVIKGATFSAVTEKCLYAKGIQVRRDVVMENVVFEGVVDFSNAEIGGSFDVRKSSLKSKCDSSEFSISLTNANISESFYFAPDEVSKRINLQGSRIRIWDDRWAISESAEAMKDCNSSTIPIRWLCQRYHKIIQWFRQRCFEVGIYQQRGDPVSRWEKYFISGLRYEQVGKLISEVAHKNPLLIGHWIYHSDNCVFNPQPYDQMASVLEQSGHDSAFREVIIAKRIENRRKSNIGWVRSLFDFLLLDLPVRYGYRPWRAIFIGILVCVLAGWHFDKEFRAGRISPSDGDVIVRLAGTDITSKEAEQVRELYPTFYPYTYAIDLFLPIIDLGQERFWIPIGHLNWAIKWSTILLGWYLTTLFVSSFTGLLRVR